MRPFFIQLVVSLAVLAGATSGRAQERTIDMDKVREACQWLAKSDRGIDRAISTTIDGVVRDMLSQRGPSPFSFLGGAFELFDALIAQQKAYQLMAEADPELGKQLRRAQLRLKLLPPYSRYRARAERYDAFVHRQIDRALRKLCPTDPPQRVRPQHRHDFKGGPRRFKPPKHKVIEPPAVS